MTKETEINRYNKETDRDKQIQIKRQSEIKMQAQITRQRKRER